LQQLRHVHAAVSPGTASLTSAAPLTPSDAPSLNLTGNNARRFAEIARRNLIRRDAQLPALSVTMELRKLYRRDRGGAFARFAAVHWSAVSAELLAARRLAKGDGTWQPRGFFEGVSFDNQVEPVLREKFLQAIKAERRRS
jgi:hypothetical protein